MPTLVAPTNVGTILEGAAPSICMTIQDADDNALPLAGLSTIVLTLYLKGHSSTIINSRDNQDVKNMNDVTIHATNGLLTWNLQETDTAYQGNSGIFETHVALFEWTVTTDSRKFKKEVEFDVQQVPTIV